MNLFTISRQAATLDRRATHGNTLNLRRFVGGLLAALTGVVMAFSAPNEAYAQVALYSFEQAAGTYTEITGGTLIATATANSGAASLDDNIYPVTIPFAFNFDGVDYTSLNVSTNGFITFGATAPAGTLYTPISSTPTYAGAIAAWGRDLNGMFNVGGRTSTLSWETVGSAPDRVVVIQYKNWRPAFTTSTSTAPFLDFQIRLVETSNVVEIVYGPSGLAAGTTNSSTTSQVGLRGPNNTFGTNVNNRTNTSSVSINSSVAGTSNSSTQAFSSVNALPGRHADGKIYRWTPPVACAVTPPACAVNLGAVATVQGANPDCCSVAWDATCQSAYDALSYTCSAGASCADPVVVTPGSYTYPAIEGGTELVLGCGSPAFAGGSGAFWYSYTAPSDGSITVNSCGTLDTRLTVLTGTCGALTCVAANDDANQAFACQTGNFAAGLTTAVTSGVTYYIQWDNRWSSASASWNLSFTSGPITTPCDDAIAVADCGTTISTTLAAGGGDLGGFVDCSFGFFSLSGEEQIYTYVPAETGLYTIQTSAVSIASGFFMNFLVQEGTCTTVQADWTCLLDVSGAATSAPFNMTAGETYYFLVKAENTAGATADWSINCPLPPAANDDCANAEAISCGGSVSSSTVGTTIDTAPFCGTSITAGGVWYVLSDAVAGDEVTASLCTGTGYDSKISVYSGSCGTLTCVGGNDDACGAQSELTWSADGSVYYILVHGFGSATGTFTLNVNCVTPPPISWCDTASPIACGSSVSGTTVGATTEGIPATCGTTTSTGGKIGYILTGNGEDVVADTFGSAIDTKLWVYEYNGGCQAGDLVCVGGNDDIAGTLQSRVIFFGAAGQEYLIVVGAFGSFDNGDYTLNVNCGVLGCTDPAACNFNAAAEANDGTCFYICNNDPAGAIQLSTTNLGTCSPTAANLQGATNSGEGNVGFGNDVWYMFTAVTSGVRVELISSGFDAVIELQEMDGTLLNSEDVTGTNSAEVLNYAGLTPGDNYLVRVASFFSGGTNSRPFDICIQNLPETRCDLNAGVTSIERSLCQTVKARWSGASATNYTFHFTPVGGGTTISYETGAAFTIAPLQNVPGLLWNSSYDVEIDVDLSLTNGAGSNESITVPGTNFCELVISDAPTAVLRASDNVTNAGPLPLSAFIAATPWICTATEWEWVFTNTNGSQLAVTHLSGAPSRFLRLSTVPGLIAGDVYNVQVRPVFASGYIGAFGATDQVAIIGALGMVGDITSPVANTEIDERVEETIIAAGVALYPNPNRGDFVNVNIANVAEGVDRVIFDLYDLTGKRVISQQIAVAGSGVNVVMPLNGLANGMYIANIIIGDEVHTERIAVQK